MATAPRHRFELNGGHPALDFLNTVHSWTVERPREYLATFAEAIRFGEASGLLSRGEVRRLSGRPIGGKPELSRLRALRRLLQRVFRAWVERRAPNAADLHGLEAALLEAARATRLHSAVGVPLRRDITVAAKGAAALRLRVVQAAAALLTSPGLERVKSCPSCGWFFLDATKNQSRRWCSMDACGTRAKARTYYRRRRAHHP